MYGTKLSNIRHKLLELFQDLTGDSVTISTIRNNEKVVVTKKVFDHWSVWIDHW